MELYQWEWLFKTIPIFISIAAFFTSVASMRTSKASYKLSKTIAESFDIKKVFIQKQVQTTLEFIEEFENKKFTIVQYQNEQSCSFQSLPIGRINSEFAKSFPLNLPKASVCVTEKFEELIFFSEYVNSVFLPKQISDQVRKLWFIKTRYYSSNYTIFLDEEEKRNDEKNYWKILKFTAQDGHGIYKDISSFLNQIIVIKQTYNEWIQKFDVPDINIHPI
jgi:hypothetical protein